MTGVDEFTGDPGPRGWNYWTRNKLEILAGYLPAFNNASKKASERIYLDLMAGRPVNVDARTQEVFDGSARIAMASDPGFTRLAFGEQPINAAALEADLNKRHPSENFHVYAGDCNVTIRDMLADLGEYRWAPTFAFIDQQAAEVHWSTLAAISAFRSGKRKAEIWILCSPAMIIKGVSGSNNEQYANKVDKFYGTRDWRRVFDARNAELITGEGFRSEMVNLLRWRLEQDLGYKYTARVPMRMVNGVAIYDMVFATDHDAGLKIMSHLYGRAAEREPEMIRESRERQAAAKSKYEDLSLFDLREVLPSATSGKAPRWRSEPCWDPTSTSWWSVV